MHFRFCGINIKRYLHHKRLVALKAAEFCIVVIIYTHFIVLRKINVKKISVSAYWLAKGFKLYSYKPAAGRYVQQ